MVPAFVLMAVAQWWVSSTYRRWGQTKNSLGMNGQDAAQRLLAQAGLPGVEVAGVQGRLSDHYDPRTCELHLSPEVAGVPSVASLAITAHEIGHAMQDRDGYARSGSARRLSRRRRSARTWGGSCCSSG